jgi:hypothetical protein
MQDAYPVCGFLKHEPGIPPYCPTALLPDCPDASRVPGTGAGPTPRAGYRAPRTEPENVHIGYAS